MRHLDFSDHKPLVINMTYRITEYSMVTPLFVTSIRGRVDRNASKA